jgi:HEAT repeat protein
VEWDDLFPERPARPAGTRKARRARKELAAEELAAELAGRFAGWEASLRGLTVLGRRFGPCGGWRDAADRVTKAAPADRAAALRDGGVSGDLFWSTLHFEGYRDGLEGVAGAAGNAYRTLLSGQDVSRFVKFAWLLRYDEPAAVYRLVRAQKALAGAVAAVYHEAPDVIRRGLRRGEFARPLALLEAARWAAVPAGGVAPGHARYYALSPHHQEWWRAWSLALEIDFDGASSLLDRCRVDPFVAVPADQVPGELRRFTVSAEELGLGEDDWFDAITPDGSVRAAFDQIFAEDGRSSEEMFRAALRHPLPLVRSRALPGAKLCLEPPDFVGLLGDRIWPLRARVIEYLIASKFDLPAVGRSLAEALAAPASPREALAYCARSSPTELGTEASGALAPALAELLNDPSADVSVAAARELARYGKTAPVPTAELVRALGHPESAAQVAAATALGELGGPAEAAVPALVAALGDAGESVRRAAVTALGSFPTPEALAALVRAMDAPVFMVRSDAARALGRFGRMAESAAPVLVRAFTATAARDRVAAASDALKGFRPVVLLPHLPELIHFEQSYRGSSSGQEAAEMLRSLTEGAAEAVEAGMANLPAAADRLAADFRYLRDGLPRLVALVLAEAGTEVGRQALEILNAVGAPGCPALAALAVALGVHPLAEQLLADVAELTEGLLPSILAGLRDARPAVRDAAAVALLWVGPVAAAARPLLRSEDRS